MADHPYRAELINAFITATDDAFRTMCQIDVRFERAALKTPGQHPAGEEWVSGMIGLGGSEFSGNVAINLRADFACSVISRFVGETFPTVDGHVLDGIGEVTNIIAGGAKNRLVAQGMQLQIGLPKMVHGRDYQTAEQHNAPCLVFFFGSSIGAFLLEVCLVKRTPSAAR